MKNNNYNKISDVNYKRLKEILIKPIKLTYNYYSRLNNNNNCNNNTSPYYTSILKYFLIILLLFGNVFANTNIDDTDQSYVTSGNQTSKSFNNLTISGDDVDGEQFYSLPTKILLSTLATTTSLVTIGGNLLVMTSFFLDRQIRNPTNYFLLSLSVSDFLIGLFSMPLYTLYLMLGKWPFGEVICNLWLSLDYTVCLTSIYTVLLITIDRFCSVKIPAKYRKWRSRRKVVIMIALTWVLPVSLFFTSIFAWTYSHKKEFDPKNCDVGWSENKYFNIALVISYFWTTLIVMVILYIFIYQVASNLERKSREKQRKMSSLVGCTANTGTLVGVVALSMHSSNLTKKLTPESLKQGSLDGEDYDLYSGDNHQSKFGSFSKSRVGAPSINTYLEIKADEKSQYVNEKQTKNNNNNGKSTGGTNGNHNTVNFKLEITKVTSSQHDDPSSSFESHSDYDSSSRSKKSTDSTKKLRPKFKDKRSKSNSRANTIASMSTKTITVKDNYNTFHNKDDNNNNNRLENGNIMANNTISINSGLSNLQPRPETLAVMPYDTFAEKCASIKNNSMSSYEKINTQEPTLHEQIPFIDDEFDDLAYVLHRREINKEGSIAIKEETIIIKSPFRRSFMQKIQSPLRNLSRKNSSKSNNKPSLKLNNNSQPLNRRLTIDITSNNNNNTNNNCNSSSNNNNNNSSLVLIKNETTVKPNISSESPPEATTNQETGKNPRDNRMVHSISNNISNNSDSNTDSFNNKNKKSTTKNSSNNNNSNNSNNDDDSEENFESVMSKSQSACLNEIHLQSKLNNNKHGNSDSKLPVQKIMQKNSIGSALNNMIKPNIGLISEHHLDPNEAHELTVARNKRKMKYENRARKALRTITFILGAFVFCFAPWHVVSVVNSFCNKCFYNNAILMHFFNICYWLCYLNSPINPFMYALANQQFRKTFIRILKRDWRRL